MYDAVAGMFIPTEPLLRLPSATLGPTISAVIRSSTNTSPGRVTTRGTSIRAHHNTSLKPLSAQEVLYQRTGAPIIYAEKSDEFNFAERVPPGSLPDSDLLKALHSYTSDFYARTPDPRVPSRKKKGGQEESFEGMQARMKRCRDFKSMDETALLAFGILMEEMMRESLGETGDLAFTEEGHRRRRTRRPRSKRGSRAASVVVVDDDEEAQADVESQAEPETENEEERQLEKKRVKRRKMGDRKSKKGKT